MKAVLPAGNKKKETGFYNSLQGKELGLREKPGGALVLITWHRICI
jgi:hypothetical protein